MYQQEKLSIASLIITVIVSIIYFAYIYLNYDISSLTHDFKFWASVILINVPIQVVTRIIIHIIFAIYIKIVDNEEITSITDEMDKIIDLKSTRNSSSAFGIGVLLSMILMLIGVEPYVMFIAILMAMFVAGVVADVSSVYFYRKGV